MEINGSKKNSRFQIQNVLLPLIYGPSKREDLIYYSSPCVEDKKSNVYYKKKKFADRGTTFQAQKVMYRFFFSAEY